MADALGSRTMFSRAAVALHIHCPLCGGAGTGQGNTSNLVTLLIRLMMPSSYGEGNFFPRAEKHTLTSDINGVITARAEHLCMLVFVISAVTPI